MMEPKPLLDSFRRDAYVMEANAYMTPGIPESDETFTEVFRQLYDQLRVQLGEPLTAIVAIDSHGSSRQVLAGFRNSANVVDLKRSEVSPPSTSLRMLAKKDSDSAAFILEFASKVCRPVSEMLERSPGQRTIIVPYLVRPTNVRPPQEYGDQLRGWKGNSSEFIYSRPFYSGVGSVPEKFQNSYYSAALLLVCPQSDSDPMVDLEWIEALHLYFQMSWGFPTLGKNLRKLEAIEAEDRARSARDAELRKNDEELKAQGELLRFIRGPAKEIADQVRKLEDAAGLIQRVLSPPHHTLFRELERGAIFFDEPLSIPVDIDDFQVHRAHQFGGGDSKTDIFAPAVITRVLDLHGKGHFQKATFAKHADHFITGGLGLQPHHAKTARALQRILGLSQDRGLGVASEDRFNILRDICHRPFKLVGYEFDANLCYGFFDVDPGGMPRAHCPVKPPNRPELFLHGCYSFLEPKGGWNLDQARKERMQIDFKKGTELTLTFEGGEGDFEEIREPAVLIDLLQHSSTQHSRDPDELQSARTHLWEWATRPLIGNVSAAAHVGNYLGSFLLILGHLASEAKVKSHEKGSVVFEAHDARGSRVTLAASGRRRSVSMPC